jgi:hypothetical protein
MWSPAADEGNTLPFSMKSFSNEQESWAGALAARLRVIQAAAAGEPTEKREQLLREEIARELLRAPGPYRVQYLDALALHFPVGLGSDAEVAAAIPERESVETVDLPEIPVRELVGRLLAAAPSIPAEEREEYAKLLTAAGLAHTPKLPVELRVQLPLTHGAPINAPHAMRLFALLVEVMASLDQHVWEGWHHLAPLSSVRRDPVLGSDFRHQAARYLNEQGEGSGKEVAVMLDQTRHLITSLIGAIGPAGTTVARNYLARFAPEAIEAHVAAGNSPGGFFISEEQRCWRTYVEMFNQMSGVAIEREILNAITQQAENVILGARRSLVAKPALQKTLPPDGSKRPK